MKKSNNAGARLGIDVEPIVKALRRGSKIKAVAKRFHVSSSTVYELARRYSIPLRYKPLHQAGVDEAVRRLHAGEKHADIAKAVGTSRSTVARIAIKVGVRRLTDSGALPQYAMELAYTEGKETCAAIARRLGCSADLVGRILRRRGINTSGWGIKATDSEILECVRAGMTPVATARKFGLYPSGDWYDRFRRIAAGKPKYSAQRQAQLQEQTA